jgi:hypothetical protein
MIVRLAGAAVLVAMVAACGGGENQGVGAGAGTAAAPETQQIAMDAPQEVAACQPVARMPLEGRPSPYDSTMVQLNGATAKICYGRPALRGRQMIGGEQVPYDTIWRTGANEPTTIHLNTAAEIAGMRVEPGSYTLYTVPGREQWTVIVNRSTTQWGIESAYTAEVRAQEVGRAQVPAERTPAPVEVFTITSEDTGAGSANIVLEWENTRVRIPIRRV